MQVLPSARPAETQTTAPESAAQLSLRAVSGLEVASVSASALLTTWALLPLQPWPRWLAAIPALLAVGLMLHSHHARGESWRALGFTTEHLGRALRLVAGPTVLACMLFAALGWWAGSFHQTSHFWTNLLVLPAWALLQQYVLQGFIYRRVRFVLMPSQASPEQQRRRSHLAVLVTAGIFALLHAPNVTLMLLTLLGALIWSWVYERAPNLFALALSHAVISLLLMTALPSWLLESMSVGYKHFLYQKF
ncbi:MAG: CPBP family intramembrane metalloprotease [Acidobacteria bacterium]|nr:CPBP family intramembrane metalloprotease [Acidobacteriota bacterium]